MSNILLALRADDVFHERYRVLAAIKAGGMGAVYEVVDERTNSHRALKVMLPSVVADPDLRARFALEAKITGNVVSDHIVSVSDAGIDAATETPFIVMELLRGEEIGRLLETRGPLTPDEVVLYLHQTALALDRTHAASIVHRDLKPDNLYLTRRDDGSACVKILDFGIAKMVAQTVSSATQVVGTPMYMAPEQVRGDATIGPKADLFSLGQIAYTLLVGEPYWAEEVKATRNVYLLLGRVMKGMQETPSARAMRRRSVVLSPAFDAWLQRATADSPDDRFARATEQIAALGEALGVGPALASTVRPIRPTSVAVPVSDPTSAGTPTPGVGPTQLSMVSLGGVTPTTASAGSGLRAPRWVVAALLAFGAATGATAVIVTTLRQQRPPPPAAAEGAQHASPSAPAVEAQAAPPPTPPSPATSSATAEATVAPHPSAAPPTAVTKVPRRPPSAPAPKPEDNSAPPRITTPL